MDKRYTIFVSSTYEDMVEPRNLVTQAIMRSGHIPLGMEAFGAANAGSWDVIEKTIDSSDYYVLLIARRYGSVDDETDMGWTEREFRYAVDSGIPCYVFILKDSASWPGNLGEASENGRTRLNAFLKFARSVRQAAFWTSDQDLPLHVMTSLMNAFNNDPRDGWIRPPRISGPGVAEELARIGKERDELRKELESTREGRKQARLIEALQSKFFEIGDTRKSSFTFFESLSLKMAAGALEFPEIRHGVAAVFGNGFGHEAYQYVANEILDFLGSIDLVKSEAIGKTPISFTVGGGSYGGHLQEVYILTDAGRSLLSDLTLDKYLKV